MSVSPRDDLFGWVGIKYQEGVGIAQFLDLWSKGGWCSPQQDQQQQFSSPELTACVESYSVFVPPLCYCSGPRKGPDHSAKMHIYGREQLNMHVLLT